MTQPTNKTDREVLKSLARVKREKGQSVRTISKELKVSTDTLYRWSKETVSTEELKIAREVLNTLDVELLSKASHINHLIAEELIKKILDGKKLSGMDLKTLSKAWVDTSRVYTSHASLIDQREGIGPQAARPLTVEGATALLLSQAQADKDYAERLREERKAYELMRAQEKDVTPRG